MTDLARYPRRDRFATTGTAATRVATTTTTTAPAAIAAATRRNRGSGRASSTGRTPAGCPARLHPRRAGDGPRRMAMLFDEGSPLSKITTLRPKDYSEARTIGERFRDGTPVIMDLVSMDNADAKRLVDFAAGLPCARAAPSTRSQPRSSCCPRRHRRQSRRPSPHRRNRLLRLPVADRTHTGRFYICSASAGWRRRAGAGGLSTGFAGATRRQPVSNVNRLV